uniref:ATP synthase protein MI25 n=1 Tax=Tetraselmis sp. CCMP 881 TaxID=1812852 RepID=A0A650AR49_9CHLO|nr:ATP synthase F0 subunit beta [Tetraselmis sp. CCMP 881]
MNFLKFNDYYAFIFIFLFFSLITSNHFLIFNEETVVAICFISFIIFSFKFFGQSLKESLDERSEAIKNEFYQALVLEQKYCQKAIYQYEKPKVLVQNFVNLSKLLLQAKLLWYKKFLDQSLATFFEDSVRSLVDAKLNERVVQISYSKKTFQEKWLQVIANEFENSVLSEFEKANNEGFQDVLFNQSIIAVENEFKSK